MVESILLGISGLLNPLNLGIIVFGLLIGMIFGALPGFSATMALAVLVPFSFWLPPDAALLMLSAVYCSSIYAGSIPAVLLGIPGTPASVPTTYDGLAMTKQGKAGQALTYVTFGSSAGGVLSSIALLVGAPLLALVALKVGPPEQMMLAIFGLSVVCTLSSGNMLKGVLVGFLSLLLATVGQDPVEGYPRFTLGFHELLGGIPLIPVLIGLFTIPEVFNMIEQRTKNRRTPPKIGSLKVTLREKMRMFLLTFRSACIGIGIGIIPAAGPEIASFISYNEAIRSSKNPEKFGKGAPEGIVAAEAANNGVTGGSLIPLLTLSIPGSAPAAVFLGALLIHGLRPGPTLFTQNTDIVYTLLVGFIVINILMYFIGLLFNRVSSQVIKVPVNILIPIILVFAILGSFAVQRALFDVGIMLISGLIGYFMIKHHYPVAPIALALILGPLLEQALQQSLTMTQGNLLLVFSRPLTIVFLILTLLSLVWPLLSKVFVKLKPRQDHNNYLNK
ncbi:tripartite tricarboxylate transporter permease [Halalkalibacter oceani]|uniref:tripartite tricarboxylate transporter permease n=1 Tax=Halalkalibacter oceani TaxID=1653776 RepID=UPI0033962B0F